MPVNVKQIKERVTKMNNAWAQGAPTVAFRGIKQTAFDAAIQTAAAADQDVANIAALLIMKRDQRDSLYANLNGDSVKIRVGLEGHEEFGPDHPMYEAMGFVRESTRKSGLTRKKTLKP